MFRSLATVFVAVWLLVRVTYYTPTGNPMYSGVYPQYGDAACSWNLPLGTRLRLPDGYEVTCWDRGQLGSQGWLDLFAPSPAIGRGFIARYGEWAWVEVMGEAGEE